MSVWYDNLTAGETDSVLRLKLLPRYYDLWRQLILKKLLQDTKNHQGSILGRYKYCLSLSEISNA